jgi:hypothetical protein
MRESLVIAESSNRESLLVISDSVRFVWNLFQYSDGSSEEVTLDRPAALPVGYGPGIRSHRTGSSLDSGGWGLRATARNVQCRRAQPVTAHVWITIQFINASSRSQPRTARRRPTPATGTGTRFYGTGRRATPPPAEISEPPAMARALTKRVNYYGLNISVVL